ncbi:pimeloyl-ACP methyl ester carboxylesterase [Rhodococcus sp. SMB37]|uniref:alpha/beta fold hydrolase n=1 Tax=Rhodococcus sp. SMB37 TaxID=2512213 RepID=UPI001042E460|nr:alpha/beta hydrolase [Rhodococcus sp. SMB37]TCN58488.1 pimeloyl-ACP methyl ester carboxylesterase [Rhodococcus sp. SMB37]
MPETAAFDSAGFESTAVRLGDLTFDVRFAGPADGPPIVLLHGFPQTSRCWNAVAEELAGNGMRVLLPDQRGYSPGARPTEVAEYRIDHLRADVLGILDAFGVDDAHIVGHDWGSSVAWHVAAHHPARVRSLTALSIPHLAAFGLALREDDDQKARSTYFSLFREAGKAEHVLLADDAHRLRALYGEGVAIDAIDEYVRVLRLPGALTATLNWYRAMTPGTGDLPPVKVPTTYVWSTGDAAVGRFAAELCGDHVDADYTFEVLDGVSHWIPDEAPGAVTAAISAQVGQRR